MNIKLKQGKLAWLALQTTALILLNLGWFSAMPAQATSFTDSYDANLLDKMFDWVIYVDMAKLPNYMTYKKAPLYPIVQATVYYHESALRRRRNDDRPFNSGKYEEIWYHDGKPIGLYRFMDLPMTTSMQGAIVFRPEDDVCENSVACCNAMVRLLMDVYIKQSVLAGVIVPKSCFENISSDLGTMNFFLLEYSYEGGPGSNMSLHLMSNPRGQERYFYYDDGGSR